MRHPVLRDSGLVAARSVLSIGGIAFETTSSLRFHDSNDGPYSDFLTGQDAAGDPRIAVAMDRGDASPGHSARRIFDTGSAWSAYQYPDGERAIVMARPAARDQPLLYARFDPGVTRVRVICSPDLLVDGRLFNPLRYPLDQLLMMYRLAGEGGAIVHCALVGVADKAVICPGVSGAGKTTLSLQLAGSSDFEVLSDDRAVIRRSADAYRAWGTPWPGEGGLAVNRSLPLASIGFIEHSEAPGLERLSPSQAIHRMVRVASVPWFDREAGPKTFDGLSELCSRVPAFELRVPADTSAQEAVRALAKASTRPA